MRMLCSMVSLRVQRKEVSMISSPSTNIRHHLTYYSEHLLTYFYQTVFVGGLASLTTDPSKLGVRFGMVCSMMAFASLAGPPTAGALIEADHGGFLKAQIWAGSVTICAALFVSAALWMQTKLKRAAQLTSTGGLEEGKQDPIKSEGVKVESNGRAEV
jgi:hypothetical protein